ncbi:MAG: RibD family protein [Anaerolineales bacterium]
MGDPFDRLLARVPARGIRAKRPSITISYAQSLDGSIASASGKPLSLSSQETLEMTHCLRAVHDAILVGIGTVLVDNPQLTVRHVDGENPQPVILDTYLRTPNDASILEHPKPPLIATGSTPNRERAEEIEQAGGRVLSFQTRDDGLVELPALMERLGQIGVTSVMVEGGTRVISSFLRDQLADCMVITIAPSLVGGRHAVEDLSQDSMPRLGEPEWAAFGPDLVVWGEVEW